MEQIGIRKACEILGGQASLARSLGIATPTVNQWVVGKRQVPAERCPAIERLTHGAVRCEIIRPDVDWAYLRSASLATEAEAPIPKAPECFSSDPRHGERRGPDQRHQLERRNENKDA